MVSFPPVSPQDPTHPLSSPIRATCPAHLILLNFITCTILGEQYKPFSSSLCNLLHSPITSSLLGPNILLNTMFSNTLSFLSSLNVNDQVSHPSLKQYKGKLHRHWERMKKLTERIKISGKRSLGTIKRWNRRKYLKILDDQIKKINRNKETNHTKNGWIQRNWNTKETQNWLKGKQEDEDFLGQICYKFGKQHTQGPTQSEQNFKTN